MNKKISALLMRKGYKKIDVKITSENSDKYMEFEHVNGGEHFFTVGNDYVDVVNLYYKPRELGEYLSKINYLLSSKLAVRFQKQVRILTIVVENEDISDNLKNLTEQVSGIWFVDEVYKRIMIYENQPKDFANLYGEITSLLEEKHNNISSQLKKVISPVNSAIIIINILFYVYLAYIGDTYSGSFMYSHGAITWESIFIHGQYYRLVTCIFIHFGISHLSGNMLVLFFIGNRVEKAIGSCKYFVLYFGSGIFSSFMSVYTSYIRSENMVAGGASGAIFGVVGALLVISLFYRNRVKNIDVVSIILFVAYSLYSGLTSTGVDNVAHVAGFVSGSIICAALLEFHKKNKQNVS